jgi:hypothetical protein
MTWSMLLQSPHCVARCSVLQALFPSTFIPLPASLPTTTAHNAHHPLVCILCQTGVPSSILVSVREASWANSHSHDSRTKPLLCLIRSRLKNALWGVEIYLPPHTLPAVVHRPRGEIPASGMWFRSRAKLVEIVAGAGTSSALGFMKEPVWSRRGRRA